MKEEILEVAESLARKVLHLGDNFESIKFSVTDKLVDITMSNGIIVTKVSLPRYLVDSTIEFKLEGNPEIDSVYNSKVHMRFGQYENSIPQDIEPEEPKAIKKTLKKRG